MEIRDENFASVIGRNLLDEVARCLSRGSVITPERVSVFSPVAARYITTGEIDWGIGRSPIWVLVNDYLTEAAFQNILEQPPLDVLTARYADYISGVFFDMEAAVEAVSDVDTAASVITALTAELISLIEGVEAHFSTVITSADITKPLFDTVWL